jgi:PleD family two-component response regulator
MFATARSLALPWKYWCFAFAIITISACVAADGTWSVADADFLRSSARAAQMIRGAFAGGAERAAIILVVDDDEIVLDYLRHLIASAGYEVVTATNAEGALISLAQDLARLVILDVIMPGTDGLALCRAIRRLPYSDHVYIMLHTSRTGAADILDGFAAGADDYVRKGTPQAEMIEHIHAAQRALSVKRIR